MSELKISDLSVGDWVRIKILPVPRKILSIDGRNGVLSFEREKTAPIEKIETIPITPEILKKNGVYNSDSEMWSIGKRVVVSRGLRKYRVHIYDCHINHIEVAVSAEYVHQLQHALRLAGIDKEIEL